jgi:alkylation response protein AidB-like acyl-CoA dehydrogenase
MNPVEARPRNVPQQELVEAALSLRPLLRKNMPEADTLRRLPDSTVNAMQAAGLWKVQTPRRFGGHEASLATKMEISAALGLGCGSTSWVFFIINICHWLAALHTDRAQKDIWGDNPDARVCGVLPPWSASKKVKGGFEVTGKWAFSSGCYHADWAVLGIPLVDEQGNRQDDALALIPMKDIKIEDTWHMAGMRATGSNTLVVEKAFVPDYRVLPMSRAIAGDYNTEHKNEVCYRTSLFPQLGIELAGPQLGLGRAALEYVIEKSGSRAVTYTKYEKQTQSVAHHQGIAEASMLVDGAGLHCQRAVSDIWGAAERGEKLDHLARARVRADTGWAVRQVSQAFDKLMSLHGTSAFASGSPMQQWWRDSQVAARHAVAEPLINMEIYGGALLGQPSITPLV